MEIAEKVVPRISVVLSKIFLWLLKWFCIDIKFSGVWRKIPQMLLAACLHLISFSSCDENASQYFVFLFFSILLVFIKIAFSELRYEQKIDLVEQTDSGIVDCQWKTWHYLKTTKI